MGNGLSNVYISVSSSVNLLENYTQEQIARADDLIFHLMESNITINDGFQDLSVVNAVDLIRNYKQVLATESGVAVFKPTAPKNEYSLKPYGLAHKHIDSSDQIYDITLSNKDELEIDYSNCTTTPQFYDCIFQEHSEIRDGVQSVDGDTITTFMGRLDPAKTAKLSRPVNIDYKIETMEEVDFVYLWGIFISAEDCGDDDITRLQICDPDEVGVAAGLYTSEQIQAMAYIVKEYDECWAKHINELIEFNGPDGAPGEILNGMVLRVKYYCKDTSKTDIKVHVDYKITIKE
jgi:hypothetical protein